MTTLIDALTPEQGGWVQDGVIRLSVNATGPVAGLYVAVGPQGMKATGKTPRLAIEGLLEGSS